MGDTREKLASTTVVFHWTLALLIIGMLTLGLILDDWHCEAEDAACRATKLWYLLMHKSFGLTVLALAAARILWRLSQGLPERVGPLPRWRNVLATVTHVVLLTATLALPLSGIWYSVQSNREVALFGVPIIPKLNEQCAIAQNAEQCKAMSHDAYELHGTLAWILIGVIALHILGALWHHLKDRDGTLRRMLGARVETGPSEAA